VLASVARPRAIGGWNAGGTSKPAELVDLPADPKPLGAVGGADTAVPGLQGDFRGLPCRRWPRETVRARRLRLAAAAARGGV
jgi:hypothetical protein